MDIKQSPGHIVKKNHDYIVVNCLLNNKEEDLKNIYLPREILEDTKIFFF